MASRFRRGCYVCGQPGHLADACSSNERLCFNCGQPGHETSACSAPRTAEVKMCYGCGGKGHIRADCPNPNAARSSPACFTCNQPGHLARNCPQSGGFGATAPVRAPTLAARLGGVPGEVRCRRCNGLNHFARDCKANPTTVGAALGYMGGGAAPGARRIKTCFTCKQPGHIARECPVTADPPSGPTNAAALVA